MCKKFRINQHGLLQDPPPPQCWKNASNSGHIDLWIHIFNGTSSPQPIISALYSICWFEQLVFLNQMHANNWKMAEQPDFCRYSDNAKFYHAKSLSGHLTKSIVLTRSYLPLEVLSGNMISAVDYIIYAIHCNC